LSQLDAHVMLLLLLMMMMMLVGKLAMKYSNPIGCHGRTCFKQELL